MAININELKELIIPKSVVTPDKNGSQPGWGAYGVGYNIYDLIEAVIIDLNVGTSTLVSGNLVDNLNGSYTWTPIVGSPVTINTHASTNPIFNIPGLTGATTTQEALEALYAAITGGGSFPHPAVSMNPATNTALDIDLSTQVAILDLDAPGSCDFITSFGGISSLEDWFLAMEARSINLTNSIGVTGAANMGTFTGSIISNNVSIKVALQELEDAVTAGANGTVSTYTDNSDGTYTMDNNSLLTPSVLTIDLHAVNLPLTTNITIGASTATTVQGALNLFKLCCDGLEPVLGPGVITAGGITTTLSGSGLLPALFNIQDGFDILEQAVNDRKPITTSVLSNPALTIDTSAPSVDKMRLNLTTAGSYETAGNTILLTSNIQGVISQIDTELKKTRATIMGIGATDNNMGSFTGATITSNSSLKTCLQELETALEAITPNIPSITDNLNGTYTHDDGTGNTEVIDTTAATSPITVVGIVATNTEDAVAELLANQLDIQTALGSVTTHLGTFTGTTIPDSLSVKQALQVLETAYEAFSIVSPVMGHIYMYTNATPTVIPVISTFYKGLGTTLASGDNQYVVTSTLNRIQINSVGIKKYRLDCTLSISGTAADVCEIGFYYSGTSSIRTPSKAKATIPASGIVQNIHLSDLVSADNLDYYEIHIANNTGTNNIIITDMNFNLTEIK